MFLNPFGGWGVSLSSSEDSKGIELQGREVYDPRHGDIKGHVVLRD